MGHPPSGSPIIGLKQSCSSFSYYCLQAKPFDFALQHVRVQVAFRHSVFEHQDLAAEQSWVRSREHWFPERGADQRFRHHPTNAAALIEGICAANSPFFTLIHQLLEDVSVSLAIDQAFPLDVQDPRVLQSAPTCNLPAQIARGKHGNAVFQAGQCRAGQLNRRFDFTDLFGRGTAEPR